jgi:transcriptional regulator with XRE-family HTH domain
MEVEKMNSVRVINTFKQYRLKYKFTLEKAAELLEISESYLEKIESGERTPGIKTLVKMRKVYKCSIDKLLK